MCLLISNFLLKEKKIIKKFSKSFKYSAICVIIEKKYSKYTVDTIKKTFSESKNTQYNNGMKIFMRTRVNKGSKY